MPISCALRCSSCPSVQSRVHRVHKSPHELLRRGFARPGTQRNRRPAPRLDRRRKRNNVDESDGPVTQTKRRLQGEARRGRDGGSRALPSGLGAAAAETRTWTGRGRGRGLDDTRRRGGDVKTCSPPPSSMLVHPGTTYILPFFVLPCYIAAARPPRCRCLAVPLRHLDSQLSPLRRLAAGPARFHPPCCSHPFAD